MLKNLVGCAAIILLSSFTSSAATLEHADAFTATAPIHASTAPEQITRNSNISIELPANQAFPTKPNAATAYDRTSFFDQNEANAVIHLFGLATIPRRGCIFRIHNGNAAFPYAKLPPAANLYILNRLLSYRYLMKPNRLPDIGDVAIRMETTIPGFRL